VPKLPEKFEDWTPPWAEGEFDAEAAAKLIFNSLTNVEKLKTDKVALRNELTDAETKLTAAENKLAAKPGEESAKDARITELTTELTQLKQSGRPEDTSRITRLEVAIEHGLTAKDAARLVGDSPEELAEDAAELAERLGVGKGTVDDAAGSAGSPPPPPSNRPTTRDLGNGRARTGEPPRVLSVEEIRAQATPTGNRNLELAQLGR
jgi:hypothetical protein